jgi:hypothetical protein
MPVFGEPMRWVTCVTAPILLADVGDDRFRVFSLDLKRSDERIFGIDGDVVRLPFQLKPDGELHRHTSSPQYFGPDVRQWQGVLREGHQAGGRSLGLDCRKGRRLAPGVGFEAGAAGRVMSSRRKTSRAVITRTIIEGTVDMRESPSVFYGKLATDFTRRPLTGLLPNSSQTQLLHALRANKADLSALEILDSAFRQNFDDISPGI